MHVYGNILIRRWNKMGQVAVPITGLTPVTFLYPFQTRSWILNVIYRVFFSVQWFEVRGDYSFCWYWWNCWSSHFILSFHRVVERDVQNCITIKKFCKDMTSCNFPWQIHEWLHIGVFLKNVQNRPPFC